MQAHLSAWGRALADVPTADLEDAFTQAARAIGPDKNITPAHIRSAYEDIARLRAYAQQSSPRAHTSSGNSWRTPAEEAEWVEQNRILTPAENKIEFEKWAAWLEEQKRIKAASGQRQTEFGAAVQGAFRKLGEGLGND
jgi:hypothetical protein